MKKNKTLLLVLCMALLCCFCTGAYAMEATLQRGLEVAPDGSLPLSPQPQTARYSFISGISAGISPSGTQVYGDGSVDMFQSGYTTSVMVTLERSPNGSDSNVVSVGTLGYKVYSGTGGFDVGGYSGTVDSGYWDRVRCNGVVSSGSTVYENAKAYSRWIWM